MGYDSTDSPYEGLDNCPRCGSEADVILWSAPFMRGTEARTFYYIRCTRCGIMTTPYCRSLNEAKKKWNKEKKEKTDG